MNEREREKRLAEIREKFVRIKTICGEEPFYARISARKRRLIGLINKLKVTELETAFELIEERLNGKGEIITTVEKKKIRFREVVNLVAFKTLSGQPIFLM